MTRTIGCILYEHGKCNSQYNRNKKRCSKGKCPYQYGGSFAMALKDRENWKKKHKVAMCSKCGRRGSEEHPLWVIGDDENRVSGCCQAKVKLVARKNG
jgi:hypothetical protein